MKKRIGEYAHEWKFDLPWHMVSLQDWFYMVNAGYIYPVCFLHVRILGIRSLWTFESHPTKDAIDNLVFAGGPVAIQDASTSLRSAQREGGGGLDSAGEQPIIPSDSA